MSDAPVPAQRPVVNVVIEDQLRRRLFDGVALRRLSEVATVERTDLLAVLPAPCDGARASGTDRASYDSIEVLLTGWGSPRLDGAVLARLPSLRAVIHAAGSVKDVVTDACRERGILVSSAAQANALPVAEFTLASILLGTKRARQAERRYAQVREGWTLDELPEDMGSYGRVVGIVGASWIGRRVMELLAPFDLQVIVSDPYLTDDHAQRLGITRVELDELCRRADVVSLHAPALPSTRQLIDARRLGLMRAGALLINTARGSLVDTEALTRELVAGRLSAVLDHTEPELLPAASPLYKLANVQVTPHIAGSLGSDLHRLGQFAVDELVRYAAGEPFAGAVRYDDLAHLA